MKVRFLAHGNPPVNPGLFIGPEGADPDGVHAASLVRIAYWPAGVAPTPERTRSIALLWEERHAQTPGYVFSPGDVLVELRAGGLLEDGS